MTTWSLNSDALEWVSDHSSLIISLQPNHILAATLLRRGVLPDSGAGDFGVLHLTGFNKREDLGKGEGKACL